MSSFLKPEETSIVLLVKSAHFAEKQAQMHVVTYHENPS